MVWPIGIAIGPGIPEGCQWFDKDSSAMVNSISYVDEKALSKAATG
jgi:hypothetical protein